MMNFSKMNFIGSRLKKQAYILTSALMDKDIRLIKVSVAQIQKLSEQLKEEEEKNA